MDVDGPVEHVVVAPGDAVKELIPGQHAADRLRKLVQKFEFDGRQFDRLAVQSRCP